MPSLAGQQELGQLLAGQGAAGSWGQCPPGEGWCCGAWGMQACCQLLSHSVNPKQESMGQAVPLAAPHKSPKVFCSSEEMSSNDEQSAFMAQLRVACSVPNSPGINRY